MLIFFSCILYIKSIILLLFLFVIIFFFFISSRLALSRISINSFSISSLARIITFNSLIQARVVSSLCFRDFFLYISFRTLSILSFFLAIKASSSASRFIEDPRLDGGGGDICN
jgi:hypothetical protein